MSCVQFSSLARGHILLLLVLAAQASWAADPILVAHRGLLRHAPENTLPAFAACLELGIGFELDIRTTRDGHLVVIHDDSLARTTDGGDRSIRSISLAEAKKLDAGAWFNEVFLCRWHTKRFSKRRQMPAVLLSIPWFPVRKAVIGLLISFLYFSMATPTRTWTRFVIACIKIKCIMASLEMLFHQMAVVNFRFQLPVKAFSPAAC